MSHNRDLSAAAAQIGFHSSNIGIGTDNPGNKLEVNSGTDNEGIKVVSTDGGSYITVADNSTTGSTRFGAVGDDFKIDVASAERLRIDSSGHVRINTGDLRVGDNTDSNAGSQTISVGSVSSGSGGIGIFANPTNGNSWVQFGDGTSGSSQYRGYMNYQHADDSLRFGTAASERFRITSDGDVLLSGLTTKNDGRNAKGITLKSSAGISFQNFGSNGSRNWRIRPDDLTAWGSLEFSVSPTDDNNTDWPDAAGDVVLELKKDKNVVVKNGNLVFANGGGIDFSATANSYGSMGSEVLDDYEEGTWTPVINKSGVGGTAGTPSTGVGYYRKVGKLLYISFYWYKSSGGFGNNAGEWYVSGLPYLLAHGTGGAYQFIPGGYNNINGTNYQTQSNRWQSNNTNGSATLAMYGPNATTNWTSGYAEFSASGCLMVP